MNKKLGIFLTIIITLFLLFWFLYHRETSYVYNYKVDEFRVTERFYKKDSVYDFVIDKDNIVFNFSIKAKYSYKRGLINKIDFEKDNDVYCLKTKGYIKTYPLCKKESEYITYFNEIKETKDSKVFNKINIYDLNNKIFMFWNYKGFTYIKKDLQKEIELLEKDLYLPDLIKVLDEHIFIPNYDQKYFFNSYFLINIKNGKVTKKKIKNDISFDLVYTGYNKKQLKIYDKKQEKEYTLEYKTGKIKLNKGVKYKSSELIKVNNSKNYFYFKDNSLYFQLNNFKLKIVEMEIKDIAFQNEYETYFLVGDDLYYYNLFSGLSKSFTNNEWNFNYKNLIYIY